MPSSDEELNEPTRPADREGGDPVCWLRLTCESCGALLEHADDPHRPGCEAAAAP